ncbi:MAG TPA: hypothetical protein VJN94_17780 [Candidatus Binataceae bacterium]|nr:hypothetical protein [Candidatus Binataceae bacterium]
MVALRDDDGDRAVTGAAAVGIAAATPSIDLLDRLAPTVWCCAAGGIFRFRENCHWQIQGDGGDRAVAGAAQVGITYTAPPAPSYRVIDFKVGQILQSTW